MIFRAPPIQALAPPIRPPLRRYSRVSTANHILIVSRTSLARAIASCAAPPPATAALAASTQRPVAPQAISES